MDFILQKWKFWVLRAKKEDGLKSQRWLSVVRRHTSHVWGPDPAPCATRYVKQQKVPSDEIWGKNFVLIPYLIWD